MKRKNPINDINDYMNNINNKKKMTFNDVNNINIMDNANETPEASLQNVRKGSWFKQIPEPKEEDTKEK